MTRDDYKFLIYSNSSIKSTHPMSYNGTGLVHSIYDSTMGFHSITVLEGISEIVSSFGIDINPFESSRDNVVIEGSGIGVLYDRLPTFEPINQKFKERFQYLFELSPNHFSFSNHHKFANIIDPNNKEQGCVFISCDSLIWSDVIQIGFRGDFPQNRINHVHDTMGGWVNDYGCLFDDGFLMDDEWKGRKVSYTSETKIITYPHLPSRKRNNMIWFH